MPVYTYRLRHRLHQILSLLYSNGDGPFDRQNGSETHSVRQCKFNGNGDRDGKRTFNEQFSEPLNLTI